LLEVVEGRKRRKIEDGEAGEALKLVERFLKAIRRLRIMEILVENL
jgi:hypothetical protein